MSEEEIFFARKASGLVRELTPQDAAMWAFGVAAVSGITFYSCRLPYRFPGGDPTLSFFITSALLFPSAIVLAMTTGAMPRSGGLYVAISRVLGPELGFLSLWSIVVGWGILLGLWGIVSGRLFGSVFIMGGLVDVGSFLQTPVGAFIWGLFWLAVFTVISMTGIKWIKWLTRITGYVPLIAVIIACIIFLALGPGGALAAFGRAWNLDANALMSKAVELGYKKPAFSWEATIASFVIPLWAWTGFEAITYAGGEVKSPKASMYGFLGGYIIVWALYTFIPFCLMYAFGDFIGPYNILFREHPDVLRTFMPVTEPSVPFFAYSSVGGAVGLLLAFGIMMLYLKGLPPVFGATSRMIFALGFDRALPPRVSEVDARGSPRLAVGLMFLIGIFGLIMTTLGVDAVLGILDYTMLGFFWFLGITALLLPFKKKEIYEASPMRKEIAGIPLMTIMGLLTVVTGFFVAAFSIMEFDYSMATIMAIIYGIGFALYVWQQHKNVKEGIDITKIYSTLPPL